MKIFKVGKQQNSRPFGTKILNAVKPFLSMSIFAIFKMARIPSKRLIMQCIFIIYSPGQGLWVRIEEPSKTGQDKKGLISTFAYF